MPSLIVYDVTSADEVSTMMVSMIVDQTWLFASYYDVQRRCISSNKYMSFHLYMIY